MNNDKQKAIFLDRDGVLNKELNDYVRSVESFQILFDNIEPIKILQQKNYLLIVITNQAGIGKGLYTKETLKNIHQVLIDTYKEFGVHFDEIYYCPHSPEHDGKCLCRKPNSLLIEKAIARFNIDPTLSYFIGDKDRDIIAAQKAGVIGLLINSNEPINRLLKTILTPENV